MSNKVRLKRVFFVLLILLVLIFVVCSVVFFPKIKTYFLPVAQSTVTPAETSSGLAVIETAERSVGGMSDSVLGDATVIPMPSEAATGSALPTPSVFATISATINPQPSASPFATDTNDLTASPSSTPLSSEKVSEIFPSDDASVNRDNAEYNYGKNNPLEADGGPQKRNVYLKFNLSGISVIRTATLKLKIHSSSLAFYNIKSVQENSWTENSITWSNRPAEGPIVIQFGGNKVGAIVSINLTTYLKGRLGQEVTLMIDSTSDDGLNFYSKEASLGKPTLEIS